jgi:multisubunit Na+/H+ antiporter MnhF subunit
MIEVVIALLAASVCICSVRIFLGPTAPDRALAFDAAASVLIAMIAALSVLYGSSMLLDIALVYAICGFMGTLVISKYLLGKKLGDR